MENDNAGIRDRLDSLNGGPFARCRARYEKLTDKFTSYFKNDVGVMLFSSPGRTELCGNHTDHNHGKVLAASVELDVTAAVAGTDDGKIVVKSDLYPAIVVDSADVSLKSRETGTSTALTRGVIAGLAERGRKTGGFNAYIHSNIPEGSGLSSSAAFSNLVCLIQNHLYNDSLIGAIETAQISQYAENVYFGKPCGLMDQIASAHGGIVSIDFKNPAEPVVRGLEFDFAASGYCLCFIKTGGGHAKLTGEYASITDEMRCVAEFLGAAYLGDCDRDVLMESLPEARKKCGDRAVLRALHFFDESARVEKQFEALRNNDIGMFLRLTNESGDSSYKFLQNIYPSHETKRMDLAMGLYAANVFIGGDGACRVHGGGFGGTVLCFVRNERVNEFGEYIEGIFGKGSLIRTCIRETGGSRVI